MEQSDGLILPKDITDAMADLEEWIERFASRYGPLELSCALTNGLLQVYHAAAPSTRTNIALNFAGFCAFLAMREEASSSASSSAVKES